MPEYGFLIINKPAGISSFGVVSYLRKITGIKRIGHTGTLDPFAEGVLIVAIGLATRFIELFDNDRKTYEVIAEIGIRTDSGDMTGEIIERGMIIESIENILDIEDRVKNIKEQVPPRYSAIKVNGKRAYSLARKGVDFGLAARDIQIDEFHIHQYTKPNLVYSCTVSKGTYVRVLTETIGELLGTVATTKTLHRTCVGSISISESIEMETLDSMNWKKYLIEVEQLLSNHQRIVINDEETRRFKNGIQLCDSEKPDGIYVIYNKDCIIGLGKMQSNMLQPYKVLS